MRGVLTPFAIEVQPGNFVVFVSLYAKKNATQQQSKDQAQHEQPALSKSGKMDAHRHRQTAADQNGCVGRANPEVRLVAGGRERYRVRVAVSKVSQKHAPEKHDFGEQKRPHSDGRGVFLLLRILKLMLQSMRVFGL